MAKADSCFTDTVVCEACGLRQYASVQPLRSTPRCRRCRRPVGVIYMDVPLPGTANQDEIRQFVGTLVRSMRLRRGWSQAALAEAASTGRSGINRIERGHLLPSVASFVRILAAVGVGRIYFRLTRTAHVGRGSGWRATISENTPKGHK